MAGVGMPNEAMSAEAYAVAKRTHSRSKSPY